MRDIECILETHMRGRDRERWRREKINSNLTVLTSSVCQIYENAVCSSSMLLPWELGVAVNSIDSPWTMDHGQTVIIA